MLGQRLFKFVDASPAHTELEKHHIKAEASSHAARVSHHKRRQADKSRLRPSVHRPRPIKPLSYTATEAAKLTAVSAEPSVIALEVTTLSPNRLSHSTYGRWRSGHDIELDGHRQSKGQQHRCRTDFEHLSAIHNYPAIWSGWTVEDIADLQFFMNVFGSGVRNLSDGGFFNIVVPCLVGSDTATRNLLLAVASTHRNISYLREGHRRAALARAFEKCNQGITSFSKDFSRTSPEVSLTCCILLAIWYMLRLDPKAADVCVRAAESICHMDRSMRLKCRLLSARNATDPQSSSNYQKSTFATITTGTVAKLALESLYGIYDSVRSPQIDCHRMDISSEGLRFQIRDMHDLLSSIEVFFPLFEQLRKKLSYCAYIDHSSKLTQDLLIRLDLISRTLRQASPSDEHRSDALGILWQWYRVYSIGMRCQILSNSEMSWDMYLGEFLLMTEWFEEYLSRTQDKATYVFLPTGVIVRPLWFIAIHCRDPDIRSRAIAILLQYHRNEGDIDSWFAGHIAQELMNIEHGNRNVWSAPEICELDRVLLRGFETGSEGLCLLYVYAVEVGALKNPTVHRQLFMVPEDPHGTVQMWNEDGCNIDYLNILSASIGQNLLETLPNEASVAVYYDEEIVEVVLPERDLSCLSSGAC